MGWLQLQSRSKVGARGHADDRRRPGKHDRVAPGYKFTLTYKRFDLFSQGEYVFDTKDTSGSFFYNWSELAYSPAEWFRTGLVAQKTKAYHTSLNVQRGLLAGFSHKTVHFTTYIFNVGWTDPTLVLRLVSISEP